MFQGLNDYFLLWMSDAWDTADVVFVIFAISDSILSSSLVLLMPNPHRLRHSTNGVWDTVFAVTKFCWITSCVLVTADTTSMVDETTMMPYQWLLDHTWVAFFLNNSFGNMINIIKSPKTQNQGSSWTCSSKKVRANILCLCTLQYQKPRFLVDMSSGLYVGFFVARMIIDLHFTFNFHFTS